MCICVCMWRGSTSVIHFCISLMLVVVSTGADVGDRVPLLPAATKLWPR